MERPWVHINCASTLDGKIARHDGSRLRISGPWDKERVHKLRAEMGAILVGAGTIVADDPKLTVKEEIVPGAPSLTKIVLDGAGRVPVASRFLRTRGRSIIFTTDSCDPTWYEDISRTANSEGLDIEIVKIPGNKGKIVPVDIMAALWDRGIRQVLVEGGSLTISEFVRAGLFDMFTVYFGPMLIGGEGPTIMGGPGLPGPPSAVMVKRTERTPDGGILVEFGPPGSPQ